MECENLRICEFSNLRICEAVNLCRLAASQISTAYNLGACGLWNLKVCESINPGFCVCESANL